MVKKEEALGDQFEDLIGDIKAKDAKRVSDEVGKRVISVSDELLRSGVKQTINTDGRNKRLNVWAPSIFAAMWCLKEILPKFSVSAECRRYIEEGLKRDYPELMDRIERELKRQKSS